MSTLQKIVNWLDNYREVAFDLLRIYLGVGLMVRGVLFLVEPTTFIDLLSTSVPPWLASAALINLIAVVHIIGGVMMAVGLLTRLAALIQIPILLGAVFMVHMDGGLLASDESFEFSALVLFLLALVTLHGSGRWSLDFYWEHRLRPLQTRFDWLDAYQEVSFDLLRFYLGAVLFVRGVLVFSDSSTLTDMLAESADPFLYSAVLIHYVALAHLVGGAMMAVGLLTRLGALIQIPILVGAVFLVNLRGGLLAAGESFELSVLVLFLLGVIFLYGSGRWSVDHYVFRRMSQAELMRGRRSDAATTILEDEDVEPLFPFDTEEDILIAEREMLLTQTTIKTCSCGHTRNHPWVTPKAHYSGWGWFLFTFADVTPHAKEVTFECGKCGEVIESSRAPEVLAEFEYH